MDHKKTLEPAAGHVHTGTRAHYTFPQSETSWCNSIVKSNTRPGFTIIHVTTLYSLFWFPHLVNPVITLAKKSPQLQKSHIDTQKSQKSKKKVTKKSDFFFGPLLLQKCW